mmetsp:Transcript_14242/g.39531  ORF Transcript_14242/g.39531 Transcript_14242/m.39531 type:complete len:445 (-) Transcript_14242:335-1669(-)
MTMTTPRRLMVSTARTLRLCGGSPSRHPHGRRRRVMTALGADASMSSRNPFNGSPIQPQRRRQLQQQQQQVASVHSSSLLPQAATVPNVDNTAAAAATPSATTRTTTTTARKETDKSASEPPLFTVTSSQTILDRVEIQLDATTGICQVLLARPHKLNALDLRMFQALAETGQMLGQDDQYRQSVRCVILAGQGRAFCTGFDVPSMVKETPVTNPYKLIGRLLERKGTSGDGKTATEQSDNHTNYANLAQQVGYQWRQLDVPVIACLHGMCFGGGLQIALGADLRFATPDCQLSIMETKWGLIPDMSATVTLRELLRLDVAKELTLTGRTVLGTEAAQLGLVTRVTDDPQREARHVAREIAGRSPDAVAAAKHLYQATWRAVPEEYCLRVETQLQEQLLLTWNQLAAAGRSTLGWKIPYFQRIKELSKKAYDPSLLEGSNKENV